MILPAPNPDGVEMLGGGGVHPEVDVVTRRAKWGVTWKGHLSRSGCVAVKRLRTRSHVSRGHDNLNIRFPPPSFSIS